MIVNLEALGDEPEYAPIPTEWADGFEWRTLLDIDVIARPRPQGSIRATINRSTGRALAVKHNEPQQDAWRSYVRRDALDALPDGHVAVDCPVRVVIEFVLVRPKSTPKRAIDPIPAATRPDGDKLERAVWDALGEAGVYRDDSRITSWAGSKRLARADEPPHARIRVAVPA
ncbi:MAG: RusA family crossover junction endodeoxyribonuclease [Williamsia herbipolensis]|nr:RusA family crossover junction endodeoxyribonuclease [Williamsia herbipolensis]